MSNAAYDKARAEHYDIISNMSFPSTIEGGNLQKFVNANIILYEGVNDFSHELTTSEQNCNLMMEFKNYHAKSFARDDWKMIVYREGFGYHIAIINLKEQIFAKTFAQVQRINIETY